MNKFQRKRFFLRDSSQPRLLITIELLFLLLIIVSGIILYLAVNQDLTTTYLQAHLRIKNVQDLLLPTLVGVNLVGLALAAVLLLFYTHRIAGPVYRLCRVLRQMGQGNFIEAPIFRHGDELKELELAATEMLTGLAHSIFKLQANARGASILVAGLSANHPNLSVELEHLRAATDEIENELARFQLCIDSNDSQRSEQCTQHQRPS